jgi:hypothetical protein
MTGTVHHLNLNTKNANIERGLRFLNLNEEWDKANQGPHSSSLNISLDHNIYRLDKLDLDVLLRRVHLSVYSQN